MSDWREITLGELCDSGQALLQTGPFGSQLHSHDYRASGVPVVPTEAIGHRRIKEDVVPRVSEETAARLARHRLHAGDILFARRGAQATGRSAIAENRHVGWLCGTGAILLRLTTPQVDPGYLSFLLSSGAASEWLKTHAVGAVMPNLNESVLRQLSLRLPPFGEQRAIASVLASLDDKVELNRRMNETLEALAQGLFKSWFVDASERGLPNAWQREPFTQTVEILGGGTPKTSAPEYWGGDTPWFAVADAPRQADVFVIDTEKKVTAVGLENSSAQVLRVGTTIVSARGTVGKVALVGVPMAMNQSCYGLQGKVDRKGYYTYFATRALVSTLQQRAHGSVFDTITRDTLASVQVTVPEAAVVERFEQRVSPLLERIRNNLFESRTLAALRDTLLLKLLSGELRVPAAAKLAGYA